MEIKSQIKAYCEECLQHKINQLQQLIQQVEHSLQSETKSTAGDKHETGRAMLQLEREKLGFQSQEVEQQQCIVNKIQPEMSHSIVTLGSLVETSWANYFVAISTPVYQLDGKMYYGISLESPIGKLLKGKTEGDSFVFNEKEVTLQKIR